MILESQINFDFPTPPWLLLPEEEIENKKVCKPKRRRLPPLLALANPKITCFRIKEYELRQSELDLSIFLELPEDLVQDNELETLVYEDGYPWESRTNDGILELVEVFYYKSLELLTKDKTSPTESELFDVLTWIFESPVLYARKNGSSIRVKTENVAFSFRFCCKALRYDADELQNEIRNIIRKEYPKPRLAKLCNSYTYRLYKKP